MLPHPQPEQLNGSSRGQIVRFGLQGYEYEVAQTLSLTTYFQIKKLYHPDQINCFYCYNGKIFKVNDKKGMGETEEDHIRCIPPIHQKPEASTRTLFSIPSQRNDTLPDGLPVCLYNF